MLFQASATGGIRYNKVVHKLHRYIKDWPSGEGVKLNNTRYVLEKWNIVLFTVRSHRKQFRNIIAGRGIRQYATVQYDALELHFAV